MVLCWRQVWRNALWVKKFQLHGEIYIFTWTKYIFSPSKKWKKRSLPILLGFSCISWPLNVQRRLVLETKFSGILFSTF